MKLISIRIPDNHHTPNTLESTAGTALRLINGRMANKVLILLPKATPLREELFEHNEKSSVKIIEGYEKAAAVDVGEFDHVIYGPGSFKSFYEIIKSNLK